jgi:hypothetical protein
LGMGDDFSAFDQKDSREPHIAKTPREINGQRLYTFSIAT